VKIDKNLSPFGWYVGSYLLRFIELNQDGNFDDEKQFLTWEVSDQYRPSSPDLATP